jgi:putative endonuclease
MDRERKGGWVYMMADRYRGTTYVGVTSDLAARIHQHREGRGSGFCERYGLKRLVWAERGDTIEDCITHEKRVKRWRREWKFALVEKANPDWLDLFDQLAGA